MYLMYSLFLFFEGQTLLGQSGAQYSDRLWTNSVKCKQFFLRRPGKIGKLMIAGNDQGSPCRIAGFNGKVALGRSCRGLSRMEIPHFFGYLSKEPWTSVDESMAEIKRA